MIVTLQPTTIFPARISNLKVSTSGRRVNGCWMALHQTTFERLPVEIVQEIFISCLDALDDLGIEVSEHIADGSLLSKYPVVFTSVCKYWTYLALTCPRLWATIPVMIDHPGMQEYTPPLPVVEKWIERSSSFPLTFSIKQFEQDGDQHEGPFEPKLKRVLEIFLPHHFRWKQLFLVPGRASTGLSLLNNPSSSLMTYPELRHITLRNNSWNDSEIKDDAAGLAHLLKHAPRLAAIDADLAYPIPGATASEDFRHLIRAAIPWDQLEHLSFNSMTDTFTPLRVLEILGRDCPKLRSVTLHVARDVGEEDVGEEDGGAFHPDQFQQRLSRAQDLYPSACHDRLETLFLLPIHFDVSIIILKRATLPKLRNFSLFVPYARHDDQEVWKEKILVDELISFVRRSLCALKVLTYVTFSAKSLHPPPVLEFLNSVSTSLQLLCLQVYKADELLKALTARGTRPNDTQILCPNLHTMKLTSWRYGGHGLLADMVESRWNPPSKLRSISAGFIFAYFPFEDLSEPEPDRSVFTEDVHRLQALNMDGSGRKIRLTVYGNGTVTNLVE